MNALRALVVFVVLALSACGGADDERACALLEDIPDQAEEATLEGVTAVAQAAQDSEVSELRALGERLAQNLTRGRALERLAPGSFLEVVQTDLDDLRRACGDLRAALVVTMRDGCSASSVRRITPPSPSTIEPENLEALAGPDEGLAITSRALSSAFMQPWRVPRSRSNCGGPASSCALPKRFGGS
jgi:hypothetical protein